jgi:gamma-glutamyltranspeptidase
MQDLANWKVKIEEPLTTNYKGVDVYKLQQWQQGPALLQALNIVENADVKGMGYNSARYLHTVYQAMSMAFADRDFYYGDPDFRPRAVGGPGWAEYARAVHLSPSATIPSPSGRSVSVPGRPTPSRNC